MSSDKKTIKPVLKKVLAILVVILFVLHMAFAVIVSVPFTLLIADVAIDAIFDGDQSPTSEPPEPGVTYSEFPIEVTYEIDGEVVTVSGIYVCEYSHWDELTKRRIWSGYMKDTEEFGLLLYEGKHEKVFCRIGAAGYYMGDEIDEKYMKPSFFKKYNPWYEAFHMLVDKGVRNERQIFEEYKIKVISWKIPDPIENTFDEFY